MIYTKNDTPQNSKNIKTINFKKSSYLGDDGDTKNVLAGKDVVVMACFNVFLNFVFIL